MGWLELARLAAPFIVQAVEAIHGPKGTSDTEKRNIASRILLALLPESPAAAAPNPVAEAHNTFGPVVDEALEWLANADTAPATPPEHPAS